MQSLLATLALTLALAHPASAAETLSIGDPIPDLGDITWVKGEPVPAFERGTIYVLDFWATWCGPCVESIPHVNELAARYRDDGVKIVGVAIWPRDTMKPTAEYVETRGDEMDYLIAEDIDGQVARAFMDTTGRDSIPTAMIIDRQGRLVWVDHPMAGLDEALAAVVDGTHDLEAAAQAMVARRLAEAEWAAVLEKAQPLLSSARKARKAEDWPTAVVSSRALVELHPNFAGFWRLCYDGLVVQEQYDEARAWYRELVEERFPDNADALNMLAWQMVDPETEYVEDARDLDAAFMAARRASELTDDAVPSILDTLARVHFVRGERDEAIAIQGRAVEQASDERRPALQATLDDYLQSDA